MRIDRQGKKIERRFRDRPIAKEKYEKLMIFIGALVIVYLVISFFCVVKVMGEWWLR